MGATTPDLLPWPENGDPAMVPQDMQELAQATQTALDKRILISITAHNDVPLSSGWVQSATSYGPLHVWKFGRLVFCSGIANRTTDLNVTDNTRYNLGTIPAGFRPGYALRAPTTYSQSNSSGVTQLSVGQLEVLTDGSLGLWVNTDGKILAGNHFVSLGAGISWVTP